MSNIPILATIEKVEEVSGKYGLEKMSTVTMDDGSQTKVYTKPAAASIYSALAPGIRVELMPKSSGAGWLISKVSDTPAPADQAPAKKNGSGTQHTGPQHQRMSREEAGAWIETAAGQYAYCVKCLREKLESIGETDIAGDLLKAGATSMFIELQRKI